MILSEEYCICKTKDGRHLKNCCDLNYTRLMDIEKAQEKATMEVNLEFKRVNKL